MSKIKWMGPLCGNYTARVYSKRYARELPVTVRRLGTAARPYRYRTYVSGSAMQLENQGFTSKLHDAKRVGVEYIARLDSKVSFEVALSEAEAARLKEYGQRKDMSTSAVLRQALRVYDMMEQTQGAYDAVRPLTTLGPKFDRAEIEPVASAAEVDRDAQVKELLESYFWLSTLEPNTRYVRLQDDHDGEFVGHFSVTIGEDGDAWVTLDGASARYRMPLVGGGASRYTRTALVILAEAIRRDNIESPMLLTKVDAPTPTSQRTDEGCVCKGNWRAIVKDVEGQIGQGFTSHDGKAFTFIGVVHAKDDYYYGMWSRQHGLRLLSCVGSIEGHGYTAADREQAP